MSILMRNLEARSPVLVSFNLPLEYVAKITYSKNLTFAFKSHINRIDSPNEIVIFISNVWVSSHFSIYITRDFDQM